MSLAGPFAPPAWAGTLAERGAACLLPTYARVPLEIARGDGCVVIDSGGRRYLDLTAGIAVNGLGHGHPTLLAALRRASERPLHVSNLFWSEPMVRLAERLTAAAGMEKAFFCNSGTEAVEAALKLARRARPGRPRVVAFEGAFHGRTLGALSATAHRAYREPFEPLLPQIEIAPFGDATAALDRRLDGAAAALVEPIQGEGGLRPPPTGWLAGLRERCDAAGALLIVDEVQCGSGRTGQLFAYQGEGVVPDVVAAAKGLAGGLPMGALLARGEAAAALQPGDHGSTFGGGPLVAEVADAVLEELLRPGFLEGVRRRGKRLGEGLRRLATRHATVVEARGRGLMWGLVLDPPRAPELVTALRRLGVLAVGAGPGVLRLLPPLVISEAEVDEALARLDRALTELAAEPGNADRTASDRIERVAR